MSKPRAEKRWIKETHRYWARVRYAQSSKKVDAAYRRYQAAYKGMLWAGFSVKHTLDRAQPINVAYGLARGEKEWADKGAQCATKTG